MRWIPLLLLIALSACGQAGDLYLPEREPAQVESGGGDTPDEDEDDNR